MRKAEWISPIDLDVAHRRAFFKEWGYNYVESWKGALAGETHHAAYLDWMVEHIKDQQALARLRGTAVVFP